MKADEREARRIVRERAGGDEHTGFKGFCEVRVPSRCYGHAREYQHRKAKAHCTEAELWDPCNGLMVCGFGNTDGCHGYIHQNPIAAGEKGWTVRQSHDASAIPVKYRSYDRPQMLLEDGSIRDATDAELIALFGKGYEGVA